LPEALPRGGVYVGLVLLSTGLMIPLPLRAALLALTVALASGCATVTGRATQPVSIQAVDSQGRVIEGMSCRASSGGREYVGDTPMFDLQVRRSSAPLVVECRGDGRPMARAVLLPRADDMVAAQLLLPGGSSLMVIDHVSGFMYSYPRWVRVQAGADMVFDRRDEKGRYPVPGLVTRQFDDLVRFASGGAAVHVD
jgi:hypothetical protein